MDRYKRGASFGIIVSPDSNIVYSRDYLVTAAVEKICLWNSSTCLCEGTLDPFEYLEGPVYAVTAIACPSSSSTRISSGDSKGTVSIWDTEKKARQTSFRLHEGAVTALRFNRFVSLLASGAEDNDVIVYDVVCGAGLFRLHGHCSPVTDLVFLHSDRKVATASKDKSLRVWSISAECCVQVIRDHNSEIWSLDVDPEETYLVTGSADPGLRVYIINHDLNIGHLNATKIEIHPAEKKWEVLGPLGEIQRQSSERVATVRFNSNGKLLACQVAGKTVEIFHLDKSVATRDGGGNNPVVTVQDIIKLHQTIRARKKICSVSFSPVTSRNLPAILALSLNNNKLEFHVITSTSTRKFRAIELQGHRADVRSVTLNSDNTRLMSISRNEIKIWNPTTGSFLHTIDSRHGLCGLFVPDNKHVVIGTEDGNLQFINIESCFCVDVVQLGSSIHSMALIPNHRGFVTGSVDQKIRIWEFQTVQNKGEVHKHLTASPTSSLEMKNDVQVVAASPDGEFVIVALPGGSSVKVFHVHSFYPANAFDCQIPVLCLDVSSDGRFLVSGYEDGHVIIWDLKAGLYVQSRIGHADSVRVVKFVPMTHCFFTVGKDSLVKYWEADKFHLLLTLQGHHDEDFLCLAMSNSGDFFVTGSRDHCIRRWDGTEEPIFIEEEFPEERAVAFPLQTNQESLTVDMSDEELKLMAAYEVTGSRDHCIRRWDGTEEPIFIEEEFPEERAVAFPLQTNQESLTVDMSDEELKLMAAYEEKMLQRWRVAAEKARNRFWEILRNDKMKSGEKERERKKQYMVGGHGFREILRNDMLKSGEKARKRKKQYKVGGHGFGVIISRLMQLRKSRRDTQQGKKRRK